ncbi:hypothetical protein SAMN05444274_101140 [Mariniphaga anaerophila]|uniref:Uncharacterized protein n=1 Tax=Mariniphaga anaerophila TaxID=1484053 RepID=A0A1M4STE1_9BACT|nr:hypothetical protein [Mariniphaga anaerophila]SHE35435.1 hypothetical protein SAMN05444274_101140 [Mariniphaga anaerophila]
MKSKTGFSAFRYKCFVIVAATILLSSCASFNPGLIHYNQDKSLYEYGGSPENAVPLRNKNNELISESNYEAFLKELENNDNKYQGTKTYEKTNSIQFSDHKIASLYAESVAEMNNGQFEEIPAKIDSLMALYPDALYFSDAAFLSGFAFQHLGKTNEANEKYREFINFSSGKYTERFRGHRDSEPNDSTWMAERDYARSFIDGKQEEAAVDFFHPFIPKYYYNSLHPGYGINPEDYAKNTEHLLMFVLGLDLSDNLSAGIQYYRQLNKYLDINPSYMTSGGIREIALAVPIKLYQSENNNLGIKVSPFMRYSGIRKLTIDGVQTEFDENIFNFGIKASAGYYFAPKLSVGASYIYHRYNENSTFLFSTRDIKLWFFNEYDISLYYDLLKGFSLKSGVKTGDFVAGIYWSGWEISYNFNQKGLVFRVDMF